jgi:alpha-N-arabinofuranosidase
MKASVILFVNCLFLVAIARAQQPGEIVVQAGHPGASISSTMWGIFFEDINMAADGGLYSELVKNRSFEFNTPLMGWKEHSDAAGNGTLLVINRSAETPANPRYIRVTHLSDGAYGLSNEGFRGMGIRQGETYHFSLWDRPFKSAGLILHIDLVKPNGEKLASARLPLNRNADVSGGAADPASMPESFSTGGWSKDTVSLMATATDAHAQLNLWFEGRGSVDMDMISLFPEHTWKQRPGGLRSDLVQLLADMKPGFIRFPGGCIVEGRDLANRYQWKNTVGAIEDRRLIINRWNTEFTHRLTPDYFQSFGLGFFEYFQLAEDIGAEPLPILNCGMACQFNTAELVPAGDLDPYIQDALDLIEFANGDITTKWGALRQSMGHPKPFHLKMLGVGNEQWGPQYVERYTVFTKAIHDRYPNIRLVNSVGPEPDDKRFQFLNDTLRKLHADILDEHYYRQPDWFLQNARRYDQYDRKGPAIFAGEYAAQSDKTVSPANKNNWQCALAEAAYMTGLERNADVVRMASYAPLFAHADGWQWTPDLIWFDNLHSYGTPDYYVQKLYSTNRGSLAIPVLLDGQSIAGQDSLYASASLDTTSHELILKIVNVAARPQTRKIRLDGAKGMARQARLTELKSGLGTDVNTIDKPMTVSPVNGMVNLTGKQFQLTLPPASFTVLRTGIFL